jgi:hypothetical protein
MVNVGLNGHGFAAIRTPSQFLAPSGRIDWRIS